MPVRPNARVLYVTRMSSEYPLIPFLLSRDMSKRQSVASHELLRRAFKYVARNTTLPFRVRHQAQLQLNQFPTNSRPAAVKERCTETGRGRGILTEFGLCRVSSGFASLCFGAHHRRM